MNKLLFAQARLVYMGAESSGNEYTAVNPKIDTRDQIKTPGDLGRYIEGKTDPDNIIDIPARLAANILKFGEGTARAVSPEARVSDIFAGIGDDVIRAGSVIFPEVGIMYEVVSPASHVSSAPEITVPTTNSIKVLDKVKSIPKVAPPKAKDAAPKLK